jgi:type I restriction enzyme S subunit
MNSPPALPVGWKWVRLADLGHEVKAAVRPRPGIEYDLYSVPAFVRRVPERLDGDAIGSSKRRVQAGDVLLCKINPRINRVWWVGPADGAEQVASSEYLVFRLRDPDETLMRWLAWYLRSPAFRNWIELNVEGATGSHTRAKSATILEQLVPIAPGLDQERIVAVLEEQDSRLDAAVAGLERARSGVRRYLDSVLDAAYRQRLPPGRAQESTDAPSVALDTLLAEPLRNGHSAKQSPSGAVRTLTLTAVTRSDFSEANTKMTDADPRKVADLWLRSGDILIERSNTPELVGTVSMYRGPEDFAIFPDLLIRVRLSKEVSPEFVELMIKAPPSRRYIQSKARGIAGTMPKIDQQTVAKIPIPAPPRSRQDATVQAWEEISAIVNVLEGEISRGLRRAKILREEVCRSAFRGELS